MEVFILTKNLLVHSIDSMETRTDTIKTTPYY